MTDPATLAAEIDLLGNARVLVVGDLMLDRFIYGRADRISPEAPIPVLRMDHSESMLGGAGNVVRNLSALGASSAFLTVVGDDDAGRDVTHLVAEAQRTEPFLLVERGRQTTIKTRFFASGQQLLRADQETTARTDDTTRRKIVDLTRDLLRDYNVLVLSDYGKGVLDPELVQELIGLAEAAERPVIVDPKGEDFERYRGATLVTPNKRELALATRQPVDGDDNAIAAAGALINACGIANVLVTRSQEGMTFVPGGGEPTHLQAEAREVFDVSGAGDTVVATLSAAVSAGIDWLDAARLANTAAGIVVGKVGTAAVFANELTAALHHQDIVAAEAKVLNRQALLEQISRWRRLGLKVGFTNGCFDLLHPGHVTLMRKARAACDRLVVGLNSDASVKRLKGPERPVQSEAARASVLSSLAAVDAVTIFGEDTPLELIRAIRPDLLVKGADYKVEEVVGADIVQGGGGQVLLVDIEAGHSTTAIIDRSRN
jgi:D-beta-D-heptose 7-phosphate kinase/D-beta-D-heptose 1-phosphate adenosyltransferase